MTYKYLKYGKLKWCKQTHNNTIICKMGTLKMLVHTSRVKTSQLNYVMSKI